MKTLDEVIEGYERCHGAYGTDESCEYCPLFDICEHDPQMASPWDDDMYHYLKEFQGLSKMWNDKIDKEQENPPLDWEELKQMVGKPVWIDSVPLVRRWVIIKKFHPMGGNKNLFDMEVEDGAHFLRKNMKRDDPAWWQAYRKERQNVQS